MIRRMILSFRASTVGSVSSRWGVPEVFPFQIGIDCELPRPPVLPADQPLDLRLALCVLTVLPYRIAIAESAPSKHGLLRLRIWVRLLIYPVAKLGVYLS